ncbi:unnamed protein product [Protopolystoma xenopodis]|uniref:Uncharacterized protein n=1 Tax=Protopolystoma xenopodis TaxID=117903 RepID=A0A448WDA5_9PLAT|nr:unnamed protein product [Protopolystoma xenopodis]
MTSYIVVLRLAMLIDDFDYDAGQTSGNVPDTRSDSGTYHVHYGLQTMCVPPGLPTDMTRLPKQGQTTSIQRKETATIQKARPSWFSYL